MDEEPKSNEAGATDLNKGTQQDSRSKKSKNKVIIGIVIAVLVVAACAGGGFAYATHLENERAAEVAAFNEKVDALYSEKKAELDAVETDAQAYTTVSQAEGGSETATVDRAGMLTQVSHLQEFENALDKSALTYFDGEGTTPYDTLVTLAQEKHNELLTWFTEDYKTTLAAYEAIDIPSSDKNILNAYIAELNTLEVQSADEYAKEDMLWASQADYDAYIARIDALIPVMQARVDELVAEEERIAAQAAQAAQAAAYSSNNGYSGGYSDNSGYSGGGTGSTGGSGGYDGIDYADNPYYDGGGTWAGGHRPDPSPPTGEIRD